MDKYKIKQYVVVGGVLVSILLVGVFFINRGYNTKLTQLAQEQVSLQESQEVESAPLNAYEGLEDRKYDGLTLHDSMGTLPDGVYIVQHQFTPTERSQLTDADIVLYNYASAEQRQEITGLESDKDIVIVYRGDIVGVGYTTVKSILDIQKDMAGGE